MQVNDETSEYINSMVQNALSYNVSVYLMFAVAMAKANMGRKTTGMN